MSRVSFSIPDETLDDLGYVSKRLGISRSSLVASMLEGSVPKMRSILEMIPVDATALTDGESKRMRGMSADIIKDQIQALRDLENDDLFSDM